MGRLVVGLQLLGELLLGIEIRFRAQMHLVNGVPSLVEELEAATYLAIRVLFHGETMRPVRREDPEVNILAEYNGIGFRRVRLLKDADFFMHRAAIARQRHHGSHGLDAGQEVGNARFDAGDAVPAMRGDKLGLADIENACKLALAHLWISLTLLPDLFRRCLEVRDHVPLPYLFKMSLFWRVSFNR